MDKKKTRNYDNLYEIQSLLKIVEEKDEKTGKVARFVMVKWKNFAQPTKEPYESIKMTSLCQTELQRLEEEFDQKNCTNLVNFREMTKEYFEAYRSLLYPSEPRRQKGRPPSKQKRQLSIEEKVRCKVAALERMKRHIEYGFRGLTAEDYIYFLNLHHRCQEDLKCLVHSNMVPKTDAAADEIKGVHRKNGVFRYCVVVNQKVYSCSLEETKEYFPVRLTAFLHNFTRYMKKYMPEDIEQLEKQINHKNNRDKQVRKAEHILKLRENYQINTNPVFFGYDEEHALENRRKENERRRQIEEFLKYDRKESKDKTLENLDQPQKNVVEGLFQDLIEEMKGMGLRTYAKEMEKQEKQLNPGHKYNSLRQGQSPSAQKNSSNSKSKSSKRLEEARSKSKKESKKKKIQRKKNSVSNNNRATRLNQKKNKGKDSGSGSGSKNPSSSKNQSKTSKKSDPKNQPISANSDQQPKQPTKEGLTPLRASNRLRPKARINYSGSEDPNQISSDSDKSNKPNKKHKND